MTRAPTSNGIPEAIATISLDERVTAAVVEHLRMMVDLCYPRTGPHASRATPESRDLTAKLLATRAADYLDKPQNR